MEGDFTGQEGKNLTCYTCLTMAASPMLAIRLEPQIEVRLNELAKRTGRSKSFYARQAILEHLEELEDGYLALKRLENPGCIFTATEVKRELGL